LYVAERALAILFPDSIIDFGYQLEGIDLFRTIGIYIYAGLAVLGTVFKLRKAKKLFQQSDSQETNEKIFETPRSVSKHVITRTGTEVNVVGQEKLPGGAVLFVANHQGLFDILAFLGYLGKPVGFIAKKEINKLPIIPTWMELVHCVFMDRSDRRQSVRAINQGIENLKNGYSMVIFPEGTRSKGNRLNPFKPGSFRLGTKAKVPIVPVAIDGTYRIFEEDHGRIKKSKITIEIKDAIYPEQYEQMKSSELATKTQAIIQESLLTISNSN